MLAGERFDPDLSKTADLDAFDGGKNPSQATFDSDLGIDAFLDGKGLDPETFNGDKVAPQGHFDSDLGIDAFLDDHAERLQARYMKVAKSAPRCIFDQFDSIDAFLDGKGLVDETFDGGPLHAGREMRRMRRF